MASPVVNASSIEDRELPPDILDGSELEPEQGLEDPASATVGPVDRDLDGLGRNDLLDQRIRLAAIDEQVHRVSDPAVQLRRGPELEDPQRVDLQGPHVLRPPEPLLRVAVEAGGVTG